MAPVPGSPWKCVSRMTSLPPSPHTHFSVGLLHGLAHHATQECLGVGPWHECQPGVSVAPGNSSGPQETNHLHKTTRFIV